MLVRTQGFKPKDVFYDFTDWLLISFSSKEHGSLEVHLALQTLDQMANSHSGRDGVRIDDDVRCDAFTGERHVL